MTSSTPRISRAGSWSGGRATTLPAPRTAAWVWAEVPLYGEVPAVLREALGAVETRPSRRPSGVGRLQAARYYPVCHLFGPVTPATNQPTHTTTLSHVASSSPVPADWRSDSPGPPWPMPPECFLHSREHCGAPGGRPRWRDKDGRRLYEWDSVHGHIEVYNKRGRHVGVSHAVTGVNVGDAVPGRRIDV